VRQVGYLQELKRGISQDYSRTGSPLRDNHSDGCNMYTRQRVSTDDQSFGSGFNSCPALRHHVRCATFARAT